MSLSKEIFRQAQDDIFRQAQDDIFWQAQDDAFSQPRWLKRESRTECQSEPVEGFSIQNTDQNSLSKSVFI